MKDLESWCIGCISKRTPDALDVMSDLLEAGLRKGEASANDVRDRNFAEPNIIGSTMQAIMSNCGFRISRANMIKAVGKQKHSRYVPTWILAERHKAEAMVRQLRKTMLGYEPESKQGRLPL